MKEKPLTEDDFLESVSKHGMEIKLDNGIYRHIRFQKPESSHRFFDLITYPGGLTYRGDMGCYVFERLPDMFNFFRSDKEGLYINPCYWSEKVTAKSIFGNGIKKFNMDKFTEAVEEDLKNFIDSKYDYENCHAALKLREAVKDDILDCVEDEYSAVEAIRNFTYEDEKVFTDFFEHSLKSYTPHYLWCCYAIAWGIQQYDKRKVL